MFCLKIDRIPPPSNKTGWPWTKESEQIPEEMVNEKPWPKISIVTPSYNQGIFLEETIRSVLLQGYPNLEYIIIDGGSTDNSVDIIKKYEPFLSYWISEPDRGQSNALNKGFSKTTGAWAAWLNSDDIYLPGTLHKIARLIADNPQENWFVGTTIRVDSSLKNIDQLIPVCNDKSWLGFVCTLQSGNMLPQPSSFWSRDAWQQTGTLDESLRYVFDYEYWGRLARNGFTPYCLNEPLAAFRLHKQAKTSEGKVIFWREKLKVLDRLIANVPSDECKILIPYRKYFLKSIKITQRHHFKIRFKKSIPEPIRRFIKNRFVLFNYFLK